MLLPLAAAAAAAAAAAVFVVQAGGPQDNYYDDYNFRTEHGKVVANGDAHDGG